VSADGGEVRRSFRALIERRVEACLHTPNFGRTRAGRTGIVDAASAAALSPSNRRTFVFAGCAREASGHASNAALPRVATNSRLPMPIAIWTLRKGIMPAAMSGTISRLNRQVCDRLRGDLCDPRSVSVCALCRFLDAGEYNGSHALDRPASKKRQGTKSRSVVRRRYSARYGDLSAA
jgi:hypothetical protein